VPTANEELQSRAIVRQLFIQRFKSHEAAQVVGFLNKQLYPDLLRKIEIRLRRIRSRGSDPGPVTTRRLRELESVVREILRDGMPRARDLLTGDLDEFAADQAQWAANRIKEVTFGQISAALPTAGQLHSVVRARPFAGRLLKDWFNDLEVSARQGVMSATRIGIAAGETNEQIIRRLKGTRALNYRDGILDIDRRHVETVVRTAVQHVANHSREALYEKNTDIISQIEWVATLDSTTCPQCQALDGEVFDVGTGPRPPIHLRCRCTSNPVLKNWKALGINLNEIEGGNRFARGVLDGKVPQKIKYGEWLKGQTNAVQNEALGVRRAELFRKGEFTVKDFVDRRGRTLSLKDLGVAEAAAV